MIPNNMMSIRFYVSLLFLLVLSSALSGQQTLSLNLETARKFALEHNTVMVNSGLATDKAQLALREAIANGLPQINASADYTNALGAEMTIRFAEGMPATNIDIKPQSNFYLNVGQLLFSGNYIVGVQMAQLARDLSELSLQKTELEVLAQVSEAYYLVLVSRQQKTLLEKNLLNLNGLYEKTSALEHVGIIEKTDLDQLWVQKNNLQNAVTASERQVEMATNMLRLQLGVSADTDIELTESLDLLLVAAEQENLMLQKLAFDRNIDFKMLRQQEFISKKMVDMKRSNALPTLSAYYRYTYKLLEPDFDMTPANMIGVQMNIPVFSFGVRHAQTQQAIVDLKTTQNNLALFSNQLGIQEKQLRYNLSNALESFQNQKSNIEVSRRVYESLRNKYEQGLISGLDLITADNNYLRAETDYISAMLQVFLSRLELEKLYGNVK